MLKLIIFCLISGALVWGRSPYGINPRLIIKRCSCLAYYIPDVTRGRTKRSLPDSSWKDRPIKYKILRYTRDLTGPKTDEIFHEAFQVWARPAKLNITQTRNVSEAHIKISFTTGNHHQICSFDEGELAHAYYPDDHFFLRGQLHINDEFKWMGSRCKAGTERNWYNNKQMYLFNVVVHEIGHVLGIKDHSKDEGSLMPEFYPNPSGCSYNFKLTRDDAYAIQKLYLKTYYPRLWDELCYDSYIDAAYVNENYVYVAFRGDEVLEFLYGRILEGFPKKISEYYPFLPNNIDAAYHKNKRTYIYKGTTEWIIFEGRLLEKNEIHHYYHNMDAIFKNSQNLRVLIMGNVYHEEHKERYTSGTYFMIRSLPEELKGKVTAALRISDEKHQQYIFWDGLYVRVDDSFRIIDTSLGHIGLDWFGCT